MPAYEQSDRYLHYLSQVLAKVNQTWAPHQADDSHTNLAFDRLANRLLGRWLPAKERQLMCTLQLDSLTYNWVKQPQEIIAQIPANQKLLATVETEVLAAGVKGGLKNVDQLKQMPYEMPTYDFSDMKLQLLKENDVREWHAYRAMANRLCQLLVDHLQADSEVRIWPHHFDTGVYVLINAKIGLGFGLAMRDDMAGDAYFYMSGYPLNKTPLVFRDLPENEHWYWEVGEAWQGSIFPLNRLDPSDREKNFANLLHYLRSCYSWYAEQ
jgi:hypothetical protein